VAAAPIVILGVADLVGRVRPNGRGPEWVQQLAASAAPFHVVSSYGLFSAMTTARPEIVIEGSDDGDEWGEYQFRYKPGDVTRAPRWVAPHQPRLDWQMWFAALGDPPGWFPQFLKRLLEGSPEVLALLERNPFPARPPRFVRALLYDYKMTDLRTRRQTGSWWVRTKRGMYFPPSTLSYGPHPSAEGASETRSDLQ
jgi:lipase maturation factor 1